MSASRLHLRPPRPTGAVSFAFLSSAFLVSSQTAFSVVGLPLLESSGVISEAELGSLLAAYPLAAAAGAFVSGPASDLCGRKRLFLVGQALFALAAGLHLGAHHFAPLLGLRVLCGLGSGLLAGLPSILASDHYGESQQRSLVSRSISGYILGQSIGLPCGILLLDTLGFQGLLSLMGLASALLLPLALRCIPPDPPSRHQAHIFSTYLQATAQTLASRRMRILACIAFCSFLGTSIFYVSITLWLYRGLEIASSQLAPLFLLAGLAQAGALLALAPRLGAKGPARPIGTSLALQGVVLLAGLAALPSLPAASFLFAALLALTALRIPAWHLMVANSGDPKCKGLRMGLCQTFSLAGKGAGSALAAALFAPSLAPWLLATAALCLLASGFITWGNRKLFSPRSAAQSRAPGRQPAPLEA